MPSQTRSGRSETVSSEVATDLHLSMSATINVARLRQMAHKYHLSLRTGAERELIQSILRAHFEVLGVTVPEAATDTKRAEADDASAKIAFASESETSAIAAAPVADVEQSPAAQQRHLLTSDTGTQQLAACRSHDAACSRPSNSGAVSVTEVAALLQQLQAARAESDQLRMELIASRDVCNSLRTEMHDLRTQGTDAVVRVVIQVTEAPPTPSISRSEGNSLHPPSQPLSRGSGTPLAAASVVQTSKSTQQHRQEQQHQHHTLRQPSSQHTPHLTPQQQQHSQQRQPIGGDWVMSGMAFAAGSKCETAKAAVTDFMVGQLSMANAARQISIMRVSHFTPGLAVVRLADRDTERAMRSAKAKLPSSCRVSIYRSLPPEQRHAAAKLRHSQHVPPVQYITTEEAATARSAADGAVAFARSRLAAAARSSDSNRFPRPGVLDVLMPNRFVVLETAAAVDAVPAAGSSDATDVPIAGC